VFLPRVNQFGLQQGHIYVRRAFPLAGLAREAIAEGFIEFLAGERVGVAKAALEDGTDGVGAPPSRHDLLAGGDVGGAHGRAIFPATAAPVALFEVPDKRLVFVHKTKHRGKGQVDLVSVAPAQVRIDAEIALIRDDLAWI
jgi:hypothetical protein